MKNLHKKKNGNYEARIRFAVGERIIYRSLKTKNRAVAAKRLDELYGRLELEREGLLVSDKPLAELVVLYLGHLEVVTTSPVYIDLVRVRLNSVAQLKEWHFVKDVQVRQFNEWRSERADLMPKTLNHYLSAWRSFFSWLVANSYALENPFERVKSIPLRGRKSFERRAFTDDELSRLFALDATFATAYRLAVYTGLRRGELEQLRKSDFHLSSNPPYVSVPASMTKNGKEALVYLHADVVENFEFYTDERPIRVPDPKRFRKHLQKAKIERVKDGKKVDFHALRYTFCTRLALAGVSPQVAKELMRHSDMRLTTNVYTDVGLLGNDHILGVPKVSPHISPQKNSVSLQKTVGGKKMTVLCQLLEVLEIEPETAIFELGKMVGPQGLEPWTNGL